MPAGPDAGGPDWDSMVLVGRVGRPHGLRGQVVVHPETDFADVRFQTGAIVWTRRGDRPERLVVASMRMQNGRPVVGFEHAGQREDGESLTGLELRVPDSMLQPLERGSYYEHQLVGCAVETVAGRAVGRVVRIEGGAGVSRLVVDGVRGEVLVPLADAICVSIDPEAGMIRIDPPEGLLDLNETKAGRRA